MANLKCRCGKPITRHEKRMNGGLCSACLQAALRAEAKKIISEEKK